MLIAKIDMVNKKEYEESEIYKEIKIIIPRSREELEKDFEYLGLNYNNYTTQDTHIKECIFMDKEDEDFAVDISSYVNDMICKANRSGYTTPFQDIKKFYNIVKNFKEYDKYKILAIMEAEEDNIRNIKDVLKYAQNIECFDLTEAYDNQELGRRLVYEGEIDIEDLMEYADMEQLGKEYAEEKNMVNTQYGYLKQERDLTGYVEQNNEEEFE